jgi:hypothetical protein
LSKSKTNPDCLFYDFFTPTPIFVAIIPPNEYRVKYLKRLLPNRGIGGRGRTAEKKSGKELETKRATAKLKVLG